ncbi:alpha/beta hydrolase [Rubripirellula amarantea]|nr:alpha/beta hydrolase [Rubripirellula amarantea]
MSNAKPSPQMTIDQKPKAPSRSVKRKKYRPVRSLPVRIVLGMAKLALMFYVGLLIAMVLMEERIVYPGAYMNSAGRSVTPVPGIETVTYIAPGEVTIHSRLIERDDASDVVLFLHGNGVKAAWLDQWTKTLSDTFRANVLTAEYRGFEDDIRPTERGVIEDCFAARNFLCDRYGIEPTDIIVYGQSLGGGCAAALACRDGAKALVLERTFDSLYAVGAKKYPFLPVKSLMKNRYDSAARLTVYEGPLLQIHGTQDKIVPLERARSLYAAARTDIKEFVEVPGLGHNEPLSPTVLKQAAQWVNQSTRTQ